MLLFSILLAAAALTACQAEQETVVEYLKADPSSTLPFNKRQWLSI